nr:ABC transporter ATP-binding protein [Planctomycetota bacterium]
QLMRAATAPWRRLTRPSDRIARKEFWALKDLSFEIGSGEVVGVIGRNGAGKSTLLKLLSRITEPTEGRIELCGRVASLLEVGTGFHPELTGRENIFLNGALLGMTRAEIRAKFDAIVAFAEVEQFLDTPVKRYSSGMYVRLAFAVAAHLDPEILIIDEVLAVGDAAFQKKCLGRMDEIARGGRTVLFVSHQMGTVAQLCSRCLYLEQGRLAADGPTEDVIPRYLTSGQAIGGVSNRTPDNAVTPDAPMWVVAARTTANDGEPQSDFLHTSQVTLRLALGRNDPAGEIPTQLVCTVAVQDHLGRRVLTTQCQPSEVGDFEADDELAMSLPAPLLAPGSYAFIVTLHTHAGEIFDRLSGVCPFTITDGGSRFARYRAGDLGCVLADCEWQLISAGDLVANRF